MSQFTSPSAFCPDDGPTSAVVRVDLTLGQVAAPQRLHEDGLLGGVRNGTFPGYDHRLIESRARRLGCAPGPRPTAFPRQRSDEPVPRIQAGDPAQADKRSPVAGSTFWLVDTLRSTDLARWRRRDDDGMGLNCRLRPAPGAEPEVPA